MYINPNLSLGGLQPNVVRTKGDYLTKTLREDFSGGPFPRQRIMKAYAFVELYPWCNS